MSGIINIFARSPAEVIGCHLALIAGADVVSSFISSDTPVGFVTNVALTVFQFSCLYNIGKAALPIIDRKVFGQGSEDFAEQVSNGCFEIICRLQPIAYKALGIAIFMSTASVCQGLALSIIAMPYAAPLAIPAIIVMGGSGLILSHDFYTVGKNIQSLISLSDKVHSYTMKFLLGLWLGWATVATHKTIFPLQDTWIFRHFVPLG